jgi:hypothetical protein
VQSAPITNDRQAARSTTTFRLDSSAADTDGVARRVKLARAALSHAGDAHTRAAKFHRACEAKEAGVRRGTNPGFVMRRILFSAFVLASLASTFVVACATTNDKGGDDLGGVDSGGPGGPDGSARDDVSLGGGSDGFTLPDGGGADTNLPDIGAEAFWADDPPPGVCGDSGVVPVAPGGTPECPDDKNREGCPCAKLGETAACWPGLRKNRNRGICHDGTTTCVRKSETELAWGPCTSYVLPTPGGTGKAACTCFSGGRWDLANLSPCFIGTGTTITGAVSTLPNYDSSGAAHPACPTDGKKPSVPWTKTTLKVDCTGHFKLCYTLKAGDAKAPLATDCVVTQQCAEGDYVKADVVQAWGDLPAWESTDAACASKFYTSGGYGEMSVVGTSVECDHVEKVFQVTPYCPSYCNDGTHASDPVCASCSAAGGGGF